MEKRLIGTGTTDANGNVIIPYLGTGAGLVNLVAEATIDGSLALGTCNILDCIIYDDGHTGQASGRWWNWNTYPTTKVRSPNGADYTSITSVNERGYACFNFKDLGVTKIIFDVYKTGGSKSDTLFQLRDDNVAIVCSYSLSSFTNLELDTWHTVEMNLIDGTVTINNQVLTYTPNNETQFFLSAYASSETRFRDLKIY